MNPFALLFFVVVAIALWIVPREKALVPFIIGCCWMTSGQGINLGPISLPIYRMLLLTGFMRIMVKKESIAGGLHLVDKLLIGWAGWYFFCSFFHDPALGSGPVYVSGVIFNQLGFYFLVRAWCGDLDDLRQVIKYLAFILVPVAAEMLLEQVSGKNLFSVFGRIPENVLIREGRLRSQGPFMHPILAGTVGATCVPLFIGILRRDRTAAIIGICAGMAMTIASASSGPVMSLIFGISALFAWKIRSHMGFMRVGALVLYLLLMVTMKQPPYYLISRIDLSGGSTGWHRSFLIDQSIHYLSEWWLFGTDYTRHWMPFQGVAQSPTHTDITNYYIGYGVGGGLLAMCLILTIFYVSLRNAGHVSNVMESSGREVDAFMAWCLAATLFSHVVTGISVAYFDQSSAFVWLTVAVISSAHATAFGASELPREIDGDDEFSEDLLQGAVLDTGRDWRMAVRNRAPTRSVDEILGPELSQRRSLPGDKCTDA